MEPPNPEDGISQRFPNIYYFGIDRPALLHPKAVRLYSSFSESSFVF